jgi:hypothetical protein
MNRGAFPWRLLLGALAATCGAAAGPACATTAVYKCAGGSAPPLYQDAPCPPGALLRDFTAAPANVTVLPPANDHVARTAPPAPAPAKRASARTAARHVSGDPAQRRLLRPGMSEGEVVARVGHPDFTSGGHGRKIARWSYLPVAGDALTMTTIVFEYGRAIEVERKVIRNGVQ